MVQLQNQRQLADYYDGIPWTHREALKVETAQAAFLHWAAVRDHDIAQEYLVSLLIKTRY